MKTIAVALILALTAVLVSFSTTPKKQIHYSGCYAEDTINPQKIYNVGAFYSNWNNVVIGIDATITELKLSNRPSAGTNFLIDSLLVPLRNTIVSQVNKQIVADSARSSPK